ncbi:hypothetical protein D6833_04150 [Candidatus Parcubacteria bacterium]|nr:MAG: hypothetical protein D6833_04150 [Candidatus Parcubacteria bacterium]
MINDGIAEILVSVAAQAPLAALFAIFAIWLIKDARIEARRRDEAWQKYLDAFSDRNERVLGEVSKHLENVSRQLAKNTVAIILHDATVRGKNPDTVGDTEDLLRKILND